MRRPRRWAGSPPRTSPSTSKSSWSYQMARTPPAAADLAYVESLLLYRAGMSLRPTEIQQLTRALPEVAEEIRCGQLTVSPSAVEDLLHEAFNASPLPSVLTDGPDHRVVHANDAYLLAFGPCGLRRPAAEALPALAAASTADSREFPRVHHVGAMASTRKPRCRRVALAG